MKAKSSIKPLLVAASVCAAGFSLFAQEEVDDSLKFDFGGDIRARYEFKDNWPGKGKAEAGSSYEDYLRFRTRVWGEAKAGDFTSRIRLGNEFRDYSNASNNKKQEFPDELFVDNLYIDWSGDVYGARIGRQDIKLGGGRLIADGTGGDGSRTTFFDAVVLSRKFGEEKKSKVQLLGTWTHYRNELGVGDSEGNIYDMTAIKSGNPYSGMDEYGAGAYVTVNEFAELPFEIYWIWKMEEDFHSKEEKYPGRDFHTAGFRVMPKLNDWLSAEVEAAYQFGQADSMDGFKSRDISAYMLYAGLTGKASDTPWNPKLTLAALYLSGDEDSYYKTTDGSTDSGWNPVFNRTSWLGEIASGMYDGYRWSNLIYPHAELDVEPLKGHKVTLTCGPMYAAERDNEAADDYKGLLAKAKYAFPLPELAGIKLGGAVLGEMLDYGDYYETTEDAATFLRFEVTAKF